MIYQSIKDDLKDAMINKLPEKGYIRIVISEFDRIGKDLSDEMCLKELARLKKTAITMNSVEEAEYLDRYLPTLMTRAEIETVIVRYIDSGKNNMGQLMGAFNKEFKGKADNKLVSQIVKKLTT